MTRQDAFIAALLTEKTTRAAAKRAEISEVTAYKYLADPAFQKRYQAARDEALTAITNSFRNMMHEAGDVVFSIVRDDEINGYVRLSAARLIIETGFKATEVQDVVERLARLEKALEKGSE